CPATLCPGQPRRSFNRVAHRPKIRMPGVRHLPPMLPLLRPGGNDMVGIHGRAARSPRISTARSRRGRLGKVRSMFSGFKNFLMRGDTVPVAGGLAVALAFSALIASFTANIINPIVARAQGGHSVGLGVQLGNDNNHATFLNIGALISSIIYFIVFMLVVYFVIVVPYRRIQARRGVTLFGTPPPAKPRP